MRSPKSATEQVSVYELIIAFSSESSPKKRKSACHAQSYKPQSRQKELLLQVPSGNSTLPKHATTQRQKNPGKQRQKNQWTQNTLLPLGSALNH